MQLAHQLALLQTAEQRLASALRAVGGGHADEVDVFHLTQTLAAQCDEHADQLVGFVRRYGEEEASVLDEGPRELFGGVRSAPLGLLRDLNDLYLQACECEVAWAIVGQAAQGARDKPLLALVGRCESETATQVRWLRTRMKQAAPQALVVA